MNSTLYYVQLMVERVCVIATLAFVLTRWNWFRELLTYKPEIKIRILSVGMFALIGIIGTYTGIVVNVESEQAAGRVLAINPAEAIINARVLGVAIGGILGGPLVGLASGILAGAHRLALGGFTAIACSVATAWEGLLAGLMAHYWFKKRSLSLYQVAIIGVVAELSQMLIILLLAKPFERAWELVRIISIPMILANSVGLAVFFAILQSVIEREQHAVASFAHNALAIARRTLPYLRKGLTEQSAQKTAEIIRQMTGVAAVSLTDTRVILAFVGKGSEHHIAGTPLKTEATYAVIREGKAYVAVDKQRIGCSQPDCPLEAAIVLPLHQRGEVIGTFKLYFDTPAEITPSQIELTTGLANLFSTQLELARLDQQERLLADAEIRALQAQVNPHFLFNALNTIVALIRREPDLARQTAIQLAQFLRRNILAGHQQWRKMGDEINHIRDYLAIEAVRFRDKFTVSYDIEESALAVAVPPLILLPLVENAIKHGINPLSKKGQLGLTVRDNDKTVTVCISDNGIGMTAQRIEEIFAGKVIPSDQGTGFGLYSVIRRLDGIYGKYAEVSIESELNTGTTVTLTLPIKTGGNNSRRDEDSNEGSNR